MENIERNENDLITLTDENGTETLYQVLFTFQPDESDKAYILLVDAGAEAGDQVDVQAFSFDPESSETGEGTLYPIEDEAEWAMVEDVLDTFLNDPNMQ
ncbi:DUF1292 domain-containing protein [Ligilactobacillus ceti]|uniref:UPF0473 protein IV53_GL001003 n=1 Tax=Ligilactobacillus ceti DSM 22408 TaxID=1122146 RepID=A0A0R2KN34_9LACO|nr:DUF1292 domain-containing protein [Ligilactobacillus ceti]KRN89030.1 hypothetical protein IV53_GL001003 [Ligilactobacillus ceti DSM 22408]